MATEIAQQGTVKPRRTGATLQAFCGCGLESPVYDAGCVWVDIDQQCANWAHCDTRGLDSDFLGPFRFKENDSITDFCMYFL